jgi:flagellar basal body rod protein FlgG
MNEVVSNNLANASTVGYKREMVTTQALEFDQTLAKEVAKEDYSIRIQI